MPDRYSISALDVKGSQVPWSEIEQRLKNAGYACRESHFNLFVWREGQECLSQDGVQLLSGLLLRKWACPEEDKTRVVISLRFEAVEMPSTNEEEERIEDAVRKLAYRQRASEMGDCARFIKAMISANADCCAANPVELGHLKDAATVRISGEFGSKAMPGLSWKSLQSPRPKVQVGTAFVVVSQYYGDQQLESFVARTSSSMRAIHYKAEVRVAQFEKTLNWLQTHQNDSEKIDRVFLIGVTGGKGDPIRTKTKELLQLCDHYSIPYRLFSDQSLSNSFALNDQIPHLLRLSGHETHEVQLSRKWDGSVFIGFDLGHPKNIRTSLLTMTVTNTCGRLLGYWRTNQERDETIRMEFMEEAAGFLKEILAQSNLEPAKLVILRDGKSFKNDGLHRFISLLDTPSSLLELVKNPVPHFWINGQDAKPGAFWVLENERDALLQTTYPVARNQTAKPLRIRLIEEVYGYDLQDYLGLVYGLCYAPSLGLRPTRVPAPIYWSDGLSRNNGMDLQFRGLHHVIHN